MTGRNVADSLRLMSWRTTCSIETFWTAEGISTGYMAKMPPAIRTLHLNTFMKCRQIAMRRSY